MREIDITKQEINCTGDIYIDSDCINKVTILFGKF